MRMLTRLTPWFLFLSSGAALANEGEKAAEHAVQDLAPSFMSVLLNPNFSPKYAVMLVIGLVVLALLKLGWMRTGVKVAILALSFLLFGLLGNVYAPFAMHPSPLCVVEKALMFGFFYPMIIALAVMVLLTLIGPRLFCGWVCPVGALQELLAMLGRQLGLKPVRYGFTLAHGIRLGFFLAFVFLSLTLLLNVVWQGKVYPRSIYDFVNVFHSLEMPEGDAGLTDLILQYLPLVVTVVLGVWLYRPFCHFLCPIGLITHWLEQISLFRVSFRRSACTDCGLCTAQAPCTAVPDILRSATVRPDCFSCNDCIEACPERALTVGVQRTV